MAEKFTLRVEFGEGTGIVRDPRTSLARQYPSRTIADAAARILAREQRRIVAVVGEDGEDLVRWTPHGRRAL